MLCYTENCTYKGDKHSAVHIISLDFWDRPKPNDDSSVPTLISELTKRQREAGKTLIICRRGAEETLTRALDLESHRFEDSKGDKWLRDAIDGVIILQDTSTWQTPSSLLLIIVNILLSILTSNYHNPKTHPRRPACSSSPLPGLCESIDNLSRTTSTSICSYFPSHIGPHHSNPRCSSLRISPGLFILSTLMFGGIVTLQFYINPNNRFRRHLLIAGLVLGAPLASVTGTSGQKVAILMLATTISLMLSTVFSALSLSFLGRSGTLNQVLRDWNNVDHHSLEFGEIKTLRLA